MKSGFFELDITPTLGSIIPGSFAARYADDVLNPLYVRSFVCSDNQKSCAVCVIDAVGITWDITERIRENVCNRIPMQSTEIMVMATHCHGGGPTINWGEEVVRDELYLDNLVKKAADTIVLAWNNATECSLFSGQDEVSDISFIRVFKMKDGSLLTNPERTLSDCIEEPCSTIDPALLVLSVWKDDKPIGAIINFALHPAIVSNTKISGDYISVLSDELKKIYGPEFVTIFINGACGDINHLNPYDEETYKVGRQSVVGKRLAKAVCDVVNNSKSFDGNISYAETTIAARFRKPTKEQLLHAKDVFEMLGDDLIDSTPRNPNYWDTFFALQTLIIQADKRTIRPIHLQLIKIGDIAIAGTPCQIFVDFGKKIKQACGAKTMVSAFALDYCGYVPTPECMKPGVYEATLAPTSALTAETGDKVCEAMINLYAEIR